MTFTYANVRVYVNIFHPIFVTPEIAVFVGLLLNQETRVLLPADVRDGRTPAEVVLGLPPRAPVVGHVLKQKVT